MAKHAVLSPSSAKRWMSCPGSVILSEGIKDTSSSYADEGTAAHFLAAYCLFSGDNASKHVGRSVVLLRQLSDGEHVEAFVGEQAGEGEVEILTVVDIDSSMADHVQTYLDYVRDVQAATDGELLIEVSVPLGHITGEEDATGTSDAVIVTPDEIIVIDLKFGMGVEVEAEENPQLLMYASGAAKLFEEAGEFKTVRVAISQPRVSSYPSEWSCDIERLREFEDEVRNAAADVRHTRKGVDTSHFAPSEDACKWCKAKTKCKALDDFIVEAVSADFDDILTGPKLGLPPVEDLGKKLSCVSLIEEWCKAVRAAVESELLHGREVEGYKLVQGRKGARSWVDEAAAEQLFKKLKVKADLIYKKKLISPTDAEKLLKGDDAKWNALQAAITQAEGKPSVAPVSDKRPALVVEPTADDFEDVA